jgi:hypothetical protein
MKAKFMCAGKQMTGEVVKANHKTIWVNDKIIKRHKNKHAVVIMG